MIRCFFPWLVAAPLVGAIACSHQPQVSVARALVSGHDTVVEGDPRPLKDKALTSQAAADLGCAIDQVQIDHVTPHGCTFGVSGCGQKAVYVGIERHEVSSSVPGYEGRSASVYTYRFVRGDGAVDDVVSAFRGLDAPPGEEKYVLVCTGMETRGARLVAVNEQGAKDFHCPRNEVFASFVPARPHNPVAEGCGKRATYQPLVEAGLLGGNLVLTSIVDVNP